MKLGCREHADTSKTTAGTKYGFLVTKFVCSVKQVFRLYVSDTTWC